METTQGVTVRRAERTRAWDEACRSLSIEPTPRPHPNPLQWLGYVFWRRLPERYNLWVLYDATCSVWVLRHLVRLLVVATIPTTLVIVLFPGPLSVRILTAVAAASGGLLFSAVWVNEATDHRLVRAGWREGMASELRERRSKIATWLATVRRM